MARSKVKDPVVQEEVVAGTSARKLFARNVRKLFTFWQSVEKKNAIQKAVEHLTSEGDSTSEQPVVASPPNISEILQADPTMMLAVAEQRREEFFDDEALEEDDADSPVDPLSGLNTVLVTWLYNTSPNNLDQFWLDLERRTNLRRETLAYGCIGTLLFFLILSNLSEVVCSVIGVVYPLMCSYEMLKMDAADVPPQLFQHWVHYWCIYGVVTGFDSIGRSLRTFIPFYNIAKAAILLLSAIPDLGLSSLLFSYIAGPFAKSSIYLLKKYAVS